MNIENNIVPANDFLDCALRDVEGVGEPPKFFMSRDCDGVPILCRRIIGKNADAMVGAEIIARGQDQINEIKHTIQ